MGRKKLESYCRIEDKNLRNITFLKRKRGLVKKCMELSLLTGAGMCLAIYRPDFNKCSLYNSSPSSGLKIVIPKLKCEPEVITNKPEDLEKWAEIKPNFEEINHTESEGFQPSEGSSDTHKEFHFVAESGISYP